MAASLHIDPDNLDVLNNLGWMLATRTQSAHRDGATALKLAQHAQQLAGDDNPKILRTLAAAYAETGDFGNATEVARNAIAAANARGDAGLANKLQTDLLLYETHLPYRSPNE